MEHIKQKPAKINNLPTMAELIRIVAISWASGNLTENDIIFSLQNDYFIKNEDINQILLGCKILQEEMRNSLIKLAASQKNIFIN